MKKQFTKFLLLFLVSTTAVAQNVNLKGKITDVKGAALVGVGVQIKGTKQATVTDNEGGFAIQNNPKLPLTLQLSYLGFETKEIVVNSLDFLTIALQESANELSEVVVSSGYTIQNKSEFSGAVSSVSAKQLQNRPAVSFDQLLGGQAPGIDIIQPSGVLNATPVLRVRGINTITSGLFPLVVVDGVTVFVGAIGGGIGNNPLSDINPNDIEAIDVLKDASAAAIYGSRAANGVMVITTKKGRKGKPKVSYDNWVSRSTPYNMPKMLGAEEYTMIKNEAMLNSGRAPGFALMKNDDGSIVNTNWYDVAFRPGISQNHNISVSGANEATSYYFSVGYTDQNSFIKNNTFKRLATRLNLSHELNSSITFGANITYSNGTNVGPNTGAVPSNSMGASAYNSQYITNEPLARMTYVLPPNVPVYRADGSYSIQNGLSAGYGANNPSTIGTINAYNLAMVQTLDLSSSENNTLIGNVYGEWSILKNLKFRTSYGLNNLQVINKEFLNPLHGGGATANGIATNTFNKFYRSDWVNTLIYNTSINNKHNLSVLLGHEVIKTTKDGWGAQQTNVTDPSYTNFQGGFGNISPSGNILIDNALLSYFSNVTYDFKKKYLLSVNFRRDGLSALAVGNKFGNFGGASVGWNIYEEGFYKNWGLSKVVNNLKIRASYGVVGNSEIGDYPAIGTYNSNTYGGAPTLVFSQVANPNLKWETSKKLDIGLNFSMFNDRLTFEFDYYHNAVDGLILKAPQALSAGIPGNFINANVGSLYNRGIELGINAIVTNYQDFKWNTNFNLSTLKNEVTSLVSDVFVPSVFGVQNMTRVGYSIGSVFAVPTEGVNPDNGLMVFINSEGKAVQYNHIGSPRWTYKDGTAAPAIDNLKDGVMQGPSLPTFFGGFNNNFSYKNFDLNIMLAYVGGNKLYNGTRATNSDQRYFNNGTFILNRWQKPGDVTEIQKLQYGDNVSAGFSFAATSKVENGDYLKLRNIALGYNLPIKGTFLNGKVTSVRIYAQAANVFTITQYRGSDPEVSINGNSINSGKDQNVPPNVQTFSMGLNVGF
ncbi:MAG: SusC/RagA family TonB-linked outer membrane protein [Cytophagia bacterium]|nr:MAG: SusC/RagA family TonB-linked outer membrane protein [Cytophagales bacterium]TAG37771.1 MAG: SusC/RagA family TonB-linked outer membrane protein [Cytophagia bacterium]TAG78990.1 MAG: SusC/RagA family TonB-linked outer membrane protein [Cytophagales bacterium]